MLFMNFKKSISIIFLLFILPFSLPAVTFNWEIITNSNNIKDILARQDTLYLASSGGLIVYPLAGEQYQKITVENGLTDHQFTAAVFSEHGLLIAGTSNGVVAFFTGNGQLVSEDYSLRGNEIISLQAVADTLWISSKKLIAVYLFDHGKNIFQFKTPPGLKRHLSNSIFLIEPPLCDGKRFFAPDDPHLVPHHLP